MLAKRSTRYEINEFKRRRIHCAFRTQKVAAIRRLQIKRPGFVRGGHRGLSCVEADSKIEFAVDNIFNSLFFRYSRYKLWCLEKIAASLGKSSYVGEQSKANIA